MTTIAVLSPVSDGIKGDVYRIVQYPDKASPTGKVFFVDRQVKKKFLKFFTRKIWETVQWKGGNSIHWFDFDQCTKDVGILKKGLKIYR